MSALFLPPIDVQIISCFPLSTNRSLWLPVTLPFYDLTVLTNFLPSFSQSELQPHSILALRRWVDEDLAFGEGIAHDNVQCLSRASDTTSP